MQAVCKYLKHQEAFLLWEKLSLCFVWVRKMLIKVMFSPSNSLHLPEKQKSTFCNSLSPSWTSLRKSRASLQKILHYLKTPQRQLKGRMRQRTI